MPHRRTSMGQLKHRIFRRFVTILKVLSQIYSRQPKVCILEEKDSHNV